MRKIYLIFLILILAACGETLAQGREIEVPTKTVEPTLSTVVISESTATQAPPLPSPVPTESSTPTTTPLPTPYSDGTISCPGSVALMYHSIYPLPDQNTDYLENNVDIVSFERLLKYLIEEGYYFPTPEEFASDIKTRVCRHKYAVLIIDDSWNDPETMGVTKVLIRNGGGSGDGSPKVWFAVITRQMYFFIKDDGESVDPWDHLSLLMDQKLVYVVSHSQTHQLGKDRKSYNITGEELLLSRKEILYGMKSEPYFFVYPGGIVADPIIDRIRSSGYIGAFTVWEGGMDKSYPLYLPRINGAARCGISGADNSVCVIEKIEKYVNR